MPPKCPYCEYELDSINVINSEEYSKTTVYHFMGECPICRRGYKWDETYKWDEKFENLKELE